MKSRDYVLFPFLRMLKNHGNYEITSLLCIFFPYEPSMYTLSYMNISGALADLRLWQQRCTNGWITIISKAHSILFHLVVVIRNDQVELHSSSNMLLQVNNTYVKNHRIQSHPSCVLMPYSHLLLPLCNWPSSWVIISCQDETVPWESAWKRGGNPSFMRLPLG